nr:aminobutyraldehyde dehydrogenase [uncultured Desulfobacter sp.]
MENALWINGQWTQSENKDLVDVIDPATQKVTGQVANACAQDVDKAVHAAKTAFEDGRWSRKTPSQRADVLLKMAELVDQKKEEIARIESEDSGKPYEFVSLGADLPFCVDNLKFFAGAARDTGGSHAGEYAEGFTSIYRKEPCGVTAGIAPWNYPFMMAIWKIGPALAAGCTSILKPATITPRSVQFLGEISKEAGLPDGVLNILTGNAGHLLVEHPDVRMVSLTGATETGSRIMKTAADTIKRVHLELGGKAPMVVFADADIEKMARTVAIAGFFNSGQDCTAGTRILVDQRIAAQSTEAIVEAVKQIKVGMPFDPSTQMGPLVSAAQLETVTGFVERAGAAGAKILKGGGRPAGFDTGFFFEPTVITNVDQKSEIVQKEVFGPVITIQTFADDAQALAMANDVDFGLAASIFTQDVSRAMTFSAGLEFGTVWVNEHLPLASETPHGGFKQSGFGKDLSMEAVHDYQVTKHVMIAL